MPKAFRICIKHLHLQVIEAMVSEFVVQIDALETVMHVVCKCGSSLYLMQGFLAFKLHLWSKCPRLSLQGYENK
jgi:hypothetical protein